MGQQQLLLLVLATVIVGIATVVGIQAFSQNNVKSNADALMNDAVRIASDAQAWAQKSQPFGGPATFGDVGSATLTAIGYEDPSTNQNGSCEVAGAADGDLTITCESAITDADGDVTDPFENEVQVVVSGITDADIAGSVTLLGGVAP